jgi:hypothetical protein
MRERLEEREGVTLTSVVCLPATRWIPIKPSV